MHSCGPAEVFAYVMREAAANDIASPAALAKRLNITRQAITNWKKRGIPAREMAALGRIINRSLDEIATCGRVSPALQLATPGDRMKVLRVSRALTPAQLAATLGVSAQEIEAWEAGARTPDFAQLVAVCDFFSADYRWMAVGELQPSSPEPAPAAADSTRSARKATPKASPRR